MGNRNFTKPCDLNDEINEKYSAALAIVDCVRVLTALERTPILDVPEGVLNTGAGVASGFSVCDASMPDALYQAMRLMQEMKTAADLLYEISRNGQSPVRAA